MIKGSDLLIKSTFIFINKCFIFDKIKMDEIIIGIFNVQSDFALEV